MKIDVYSATGSKKSSIELPKALFEAEINNGLMHEAILRQQSNRRKPIAHTKSRSEIVSSPDRHGGSSESAKEFYEAMMAWRVLSGTWS